MGSGLNGENNGSTTRSGIVGTTRAGQNGLQATFQIETRKDGVAILWMDVHGESMNVLKPTFAQEFHAVLDDFERRSDVKAIVFTSAKPGSFIAGADVKALQATRTAGDASAISVSAQEAFGRLERFKLPVVAAIDGVALGGGLELALACRDRVASTRAQFGAPEVKLGLIPGAGGTQRLPRLIGVQAALDMILTGRQIDARKARKLGLASEVVPPAILVEVACKRALKHAGHIEKKSGGLRDLLHNPKETAQKTLLEHTLPGRALLFSQARRQLLAKTKGAYPAPLEALNVIRTGLEHGVKEGLRAESEAFGRLAVTPEARELMYLFFATTALKKESGTSDAHIEPEEIDHVGVLGAGLMGAGIAYVSVEQAGIAVRMKDRDSKAVGRGLSHIRKQLDERVARRRITPAERDRLMSMVTGAMDYSGLSNTKLVIEAVFEDLELKRQVVRDVEKHAATGVIFASNTSSIPISKIAEASKHPENVIGMHYFSPVEKMPLLEIIVTDKTSPQAIATAVDVGKRQGKTVIVVRDGAGFYTSRVLAPYMNEAAYMLAEGVAVEAIDLALVEFGFPVGPITLLDEVGIDVGAKVSHIVYEAFGERLAPPSVLERLVADKRLGRKTGRGFYIYGEKRKKGKKQVDASVYEALGVSRRTSLAAEQIAERCVLQMVNEAALCLQEGILRSARDGDVGAVFGLGFPPFRGGPFRYINAVGCDVIVRRLEHLATAYGRRFEPAQILTDMARQGERFDATVERPASARTSTSHAPLS